MSIEALLQSKFGARNSAQIDFLMDAAKENEQNCNSNISDPSSIYGLSLKSKIIKILKTTVKDEVLSYFIDRNGLALIHGWLEEWLKSCAAETGNNGNGLNDNNLASSQSTQDPKFSHKSSSFQAEETLKLLRQLPVNVAQLERNTTLCRFLRRLSKSSANHHRHVELAKEVVDLWKSEVRQVDPQQRKVREEEETQQPKQPRKNANSSPCLGCPPEGPAACDSLSVTIEAAPSEAASTTTSQKIKGSQFWHLVA